MGGGGLFPEAAEALPVWDEGSHSLRGARAAALPGNTPLSSPNRLALWWTQNNKADVCMERRLHPTSDWQWGGVCVHR